MYNNAKGYDIGHGNGADDLNVSLSMDREILSQMIESDINNGLLAMYGK